MKKICLFVLIVSFLNYTGCYSSRNVSKEILYTEDQEGSIRGLTLITNEAKKIELFDGTYKIMNDTLFAKGLKEQSNFKEKIDVKIALADIQYVEIDVADESVSKGCLTGIIGIALIMGLIIYLVDSTNKPAK